MRSIAAFTVLAVSALGFGQSVDHDLIYMKSGGAAFTMDAFRPAKPNGAAVIYIVSGGWVSDHAGINPLVAKLFNDQGFTVFQLVHGAQPHYKIPEITTMVSRGIRYVRANAAKYGVQPNKIGIWGGSAGGHLSLMSAVLGDAGKPDATDPIDRVSSMPNAIVAYFPPTDMVNFGKPGRMPFKESDYLVFMPAFPVTDKTTTEEMTAIAKQLSPIYGDLKKFPPTFLIHGDKDTLVPVEQSEKMDKALAAAGVDHKLAIVAGAGHDGAAVMAKFTEMVAWFKEKLLK